MRILHNNALSWGLKLDEVCLFHIHLEVIMNCVGCMKVLTKDLMKVKSERYGFTSSAL
jgi:hypothetical protein